MLDPGNPLSEMFKVRNGGFILLTDLNADCAANFSVGNVIFNNAVFSFPGFAGYLAHDGTVTIPCFMALNRGNKEMTKNIVLYVEISYALYSLNFPKLRRSQRFRFQSVVGKDGSYHWVFLG